MWFTGSIIKKTSTISSLGMLRRPVYALLRYVMSAIQWVKRRSLPASQLSMLTSLKTLSNSQQLPLPNLRLQPALNSQAPYAMGISGSPSQLGTQESQSFAHTAASPPAFAPMGSDSQHGSPQQQNYPQIGGERSPQLHTPPSSTPLYPQSAPSVPSAMHNDTSANDLPPPSRPVFGVSLDDLLRRDGSAIPLVVYQCLQAVDLFGLDVEGIYRLSGSAAHVSKLRAIFDNGRLALIFMRKASI